MGVDVCGNSSFELLVSDLYKSVYMSVKFPLPKCSRSYKIFYLFPHSKFKSDNNFFQINLA